MRYIDLSHTFTNNMPVYPGDQPPELKQKTFLEKDECASFEITTSMHVGTHMDAPSHMLEGGKGLNKYPVDHFFGNGVLLDARGKEAIDIELLDGKHISKDDIVFILTGFSEKFQQPEYYESHPVITEAFARKMVEYEVKIIGTDTPSPDTSPYAIHKTLLGNDILIIENLTNLQTLLPHPQFEIIALPIKFEAEASLVRVVAKIA